MQNYGRNFDRIAVLMEIKSNSSGICGAELYKNIPSSASPYKKNIKSTCDFHTVRSPASVDPTPLCGGRAVICEDSGDVRSKPDEKNPLRKVLDAS
ncbi:hypothetical protein GWI33_003550 [Rhynchophorus ferrugineus]|uniref:Uncharacterized protein n=1 Tax=Rhynchophorus ferrugineus TaxID=354439 RepID=A0A834M2Y0_RHYFE|nr:hypothetical protein GWI33_003550 [Rhynchophorus ferrugineus]